MKAFAFLVGLLVSIVPAVVPDGLLGGGDAEAGTIEATITPRETLARPGGEILIENPEPAPPAPEPDPEPVPVAPVANESEGAPPAKKPFTPPRPAPPPEPFVARFDHPESEVLAGNALQLHIVIENRERWPLSIGLEKRDVTPGWRASLADERVDVDAGATVEVPVVLEAPDGADAGAVGKLTVAVTTPLPATLKLLAATAKVPVPPTRREVSLVNSEGSKFVAPGRTANYSFSVTNYGNVRDTVRFDVSSGAPGWSASLSAPSVTVGPGEGASVTLSVTSPSDAANGAASWFNVTARSAADATAAARAASLTVVDAPSDGLPVLGVFCLADTPVGDAAAPAEPVARFCVDARTLLPVLPPLASESPGSAPPGAP